VRVLIVGCGYVGTALSLSLSAEGHAVFGLRRNTKALPPTISPIQASLASPLPPGTLPENLDAIVYSTSPDGTTDKAYETAYVAGPGNLLAALAERSNPQRLVFVSSTGVYAQRAGEWVNEESPTQPESESGRRLLEGERLALNSPFPVTVLRLVGLYGPGRTGMLDRALRPTTDENTTLRYTNRIHRDDAAGALRHLLLLEEPAPLYLGVDHEPTTRSETSSWLAARGYAPYPAPEQPRHNPLHNTPASETPAVLARAFSTRPTHAAHDMPDTGM
jgi:nucleoside-diphosphate-sugar epimerase